MAQINFDFEMDPAAGEQAKKAVADAIKPKSKRGRKSLKEIEASQGELQVPDDEQLFEKSYYPIRDVANMFNESISLIRYWTNEFPILTPKKNKKGDRFYKPEDIKTLKVIYHLLRERKYTIEGAKDFLKHNKAAGARQELIEELQKIKEFLLELKNNL